MAQFRKGGGGNKQVRPNKCRRPIIREATVRRLRRLVTLGRRAWEEGDRSVFNERRDIERMTDWLDRAERYVVYNQTREVI